jgi:hypothetical protein
MGGPDEDGNEAVDDDAECGHLRAQKRRLEVVEAVGFSAQRDDGHGEAGHEPEIPTGRASHHVGTKSDEEAHRDQQEPSVLRKQRQQDETHRRAEDRSDDAQQAFVQRVANPRETAERDREPGPEGVPPIHGQGDPVGE